MESRRATMFDKGLALSLTALLLMCMATGCQPVFLSKEIYEEAHASLPAKYEKEVCPATGPTSELAKAPATVNQPERTPCYITLEQAFAEALKAGNTGGRGPGGAGGGKVSDEFINGTNIGGSYNSQTENIRILKMQPANAYLGMESSVSRFDVVGYTSVLWQNTDGLAQGIQSFQNGHSAALNLGLVKPLASGGLAQFGFIGNYTNLNAPPTGAFSQINPQYQLRAVAGVEIPLLKDAGVGINQLLARLPNPTGLSFNPSTTSVALNAFNVRQGFIGSFVDRGAEGILISRLRFDQQRAEFERQVNILILNTEVAYWNLYKAYGQLYIAEENLRIMHAIWQQAHIRFAAGNLPPETYYLILGQYEEFRGERIRTLQETIDAERHLRRLMGFPIEDGCRLVPITPPTLTELKPDWDHSLQDALTMRPELQMARDNLRYHQYLVSIQQNFLRPDLRAFGRFEPVGFGTTLTGNGEFLDGTGTPRPSNAARSLASTHYLDYTFGVMMTMPLGFRAEYAAVRAARLELTQAFLLLRDQEDKTTSVLANAYQDMARQYRGIEAHRSERLAYGKGLKIRLDQLAAGVISLVPAKDKEGPLVFLDAQRRYGAAFAKEFATIADYNIALARLEWAKGNILRYNNIHIAEGALPEHVEVRKAEFDKEQAKSFVLFDRPDALTQPGRACAVKNEELTLPPTQLNEAPPVPTTTPVAPPAPVEKKPGYLPPITRSTDTNYILPVSGTKSKDVNWAPATSPKKPAGPALLPELESTPISLEAAPLSTNDATARGVMPTLPVGPRIHRVGSLGLDNWQAR
jgi:outer membrane protein TolC